MAHFAKRTAFAAVSVLAASLVSATAMADENRLQQPPQEGLNVGQGVVCDTVQQVERFTALMGASRDIEKAIDVVNGEARNPRACGMVLAAFVRGDEVGKIQNGGRSLQVVEITILAVPVGNQWHFVSPLKQYTAFAPKGVEI
jgi:hypothetical protein